jgi:hypothetical protein
MSTQKCKILNRANTKTEAGEDWGPRPHVAGQVAKLGTLETLVRLVHNIPRKEKIPKPQT